MTPVSKPGVVLDRLELSTLLALAEEGLRRRRDMGAGSSSSLRYAAELIGSLSALTGRLSSGADSASSEPGGTGRTMDSVRDDSGAASSRWVTTRQVADVEGCTVRWVRIRADRGEYVGAHRDDSGRWFIPRTYIDEKVTT